MSSETERSVQNASGRGVGSLSVYQGIAPPRPLGAVQLVGDGHHRAEVERSRRMRELACSGSLRPRASVREPFVTRGTTPLVDCLA